MSEKEEQLLCVNHDKPRWRKLGSEIDIRVSTPAGSPEHSLGIPESLSSLPSTLELRRRTGVVRESPSSHQRRDQVESPCAIQSRTADDQGSGRVSVASRARFIASDEDLQQLLAREREMSQRVDAALARSRALLSRPNSVCGMQGNNVSQSSACVLASPDNTSSRRYGFAFAQLTPTHRPTEQTPQPLMPGGPVNAVQPASRIVQVDVHRADKNGHLPGQSGNVEQVNGVQVTRSNDMMFDRVGGVSCVGNDLTACSAEAVQGSVASKTRYTDSRQVGKYVRSTEVRQPASDVVTRAPSRQSNSVASCGASLRDLVDQVSRQSAVAEPGRDNEPYAALVCTAIEALPPATSDADAVRSRTTSPCELSGASMLPPQRRATSTSRIESPLWQPSRTSQQIYVDRSSDIELDVRTVEIYHPTVRVQERKGDSEVRFVEVEHAASAHVQQNEVSDGIDRNVVAGRRDDRSVTSTVKMSEKVDWHPYERVNADRWIDSTAVHSVEADDHGCRRSIRRETRSSRSSSSSSRDRRDADRRDVEKRGRQHPPRRKADNVRRRELKDDDRQLRETKEAQRSSKEKREDDRKRWSHIPETNGCRNVRITHRNLPR